METDLKNKVKRLGLFTKSLFPIEEYAKQAQEVIDDCFERHDVPKVDHPRVRDLNDRHGDGLENSNGFPVAGILAQEDFMFGGSSPVTPLAIGLWAFVFGLCTFLTKIHFSTGALILGGAYLFFMSRVVGFWGVAMLVIATFALDVFGIAQTFFPILGNLNGVIQHYLGSFGPLFFKLPLFLIPIAYYKVTYKRYVQSIADVGMMRNGAVSSNLRPHAEARIKQTAKALQDESWFNQIGVATGELSTRGDSFSPDAGLPFGQTQEDQRRHGFYFGAPGTGKTTTLKNVMAGVIKDEIYQEEIAALKGIYPGMSYLEITAIYEDELREDVERIFAERIAEQEEAHN
ncbi:hypothetical protein [Ralstonia insidiosa]|uniref:hypothetical protein n=1 Tax=Ralstonia insidiosa TaxID=190721 RepID=UPI000AE327D3|nr:hypothetical protein [Ralstonia insidiosa]